MNYYNAYAPYNPQAAAMLQQMQGFGARQEIVKVNGRAGADAYQMAGPNCSVVLVDETAPRIYIKATDGAGYPTVTPYRIEPEQEQPAADAKDLEARIKKLEEVIYGQSDPGAAGAERAGRAAAGGLAAD